MNTINIYALINPINNEVFYVGATKHPINIRLGGHLSSNFSDYKTGVVVDRVNLINAIQEKGKNPEIRLLKEVPLDEVDFYEKYYYDYYVSHGCNLLQDGTKFGYNKTFNKDLAKPYIVSSTMRVKPSLYDRLKRYADSEGMPVSKAIIYMLTDFFKNKNVI